MRDTKSTGQYNLSRVALLAFCLIAPPAIAETATIKNAPAAKTTPTATLKLASVFSDHMVLQRNRTIPIWGSAQPGTRVRVQLGGKTREATADAAGKWRADLGPLPASGPLEMRVWSDGSNLNLTDILVGEVWIASGQSNMEWPLARSNDAKKEIAAADWPQIRLLTAKHKIVAQPSESISTSGWQVCRPKSIKGFSAVAYFFGRELHQKLQVPIGLISTNYGGTPMEAWTSRSALQSRPTFAGAVKVATAALDSDTPLPQEHPTGLFNGMLHPVIPFGMRGVIWYQGESNASQHQHYHELSELMIADWRKRWGQGDFPFLLVQLAGWKPNAPDWPYLREAQLQTIQTVPEVGMAVATDVGDRADIHPRNKQAIGQRLSLAARALAYGEDLVYSGPIYQKMETREGNAYLDFDHVGGGLQIGKGGLYAQGPKLQGFTIAGADRKFVPAVATITGDQVIVSSDEVPEPVAVRYNWTSWTEGNLYNAEELPASPFRTDRF